MADISPAREIPIANIYYLLCYAWNALPEAELASVSVTSDMRVQNLLANVLRGAVTHLLKRGLDRSYMALVGEIPGVRGKLDLSASLKRASFVRARAVCAFDEFSSDVAHNRILKTTLRRLASVRSVDPTLAEQLRDLFRRMPSIGETTVTSQSFRRVVLNRQNVYYRFVLDVCEIVYQNVLVDEATGELTFRDFTRDEGQMARLFEKFLYHFYALEQRRYQVRASRFSWRAPADKSGAEYLPQMRTDIVLRDSDATIVIDAKYYSDALTEHFTKASIRSDHLYQMFAYMSHVDPDVARGKVSGVLIYPRTTETVGIRTKLFDHPLRVATINLSQPWEGIRKDLLDIVGLELASPAAI